MEDKKTFSELIQGTKPVMVDFFAEWCGPCKMMKPILEELKQKIGEKAVVLKVDVDHNPAVAAAYQIQGVPTLILFKQGKIVWRRSGVMPSSELEKIIQQYV
jgi:thioredoxin 1